MGYKLAGFDVIGCNEIDPRMNKVYVANHHPKFNFNCDIKEMLTMELPQDLYELDVLDGSPPCSTFSMAGSREDAWGKEKKFKEGQKSQVLDTLFFDFIALAKRLQPKVVIAENVKGLLLGNAIDYVKRIYNSFDDAGYYCQHFLFDASKMGVPQRRERIFFICLRKDLAYPFLVSYGLFEQKPYIDMKFIEEPILFGDVADYNGRSINKNTKAYKLWCDAIDGEYTLSKSYERFYGKKGWFSFDLFYENKVAPTLTTDHGGFIHKSKPLYLSQTEMAKCATFPSDYDYLKEKVGYICGMSVPPVMMAQVASRVYEQWLSKIK